MCADEANHVCAFELQLNIYKSLCADLRGIMCAPFARDPMDLARHVQLSDVRITRLDNLEQVLSLCGLNEAQSKRTCSLLIALKQSPVLPCMMWKRGCSGMWRPGSLMSSSLEVLVPYCR